jgi:thioredoxin-related protein
MWIKSLLLLLLCLPAFPSAWAADPTKESRIRWVDYETVRQQNPPTEKKWFIYFSGENCVYCRKLEKETFSRDDVTEYLNTNYTPVFVVTEKNRRLAMQFGIQGVPDLRFLTTKGEPIARWPGYIEGQHLMALLKYIHTDSYLKMGFQDFIKQQ